MNWSKFASRKFWVAVTGLAISAAALFRLDEGVTERIVALITSMATVITYLLVQGVNDTKEDNHNE